MSYNPMQYGPWEFHAPRALRFLKGEAHMSLKPDEVMLHRYCMVCQKPSSIAVPYRVIEALAQGALIQDAWPEASAAQRELVISGTHEDCWEELNDIEPEEPSDPGDTGEESPIDDPGGGTDPGNPDDESYDPGETP